MYMPDCGLFGKPRASVCKSNANNGSRPLAAPTMPSSPNSTIQIFSQDDSPPTAAVTTTKQQTNNMIRRRNSMSKIRPNSSLPSLQRDHEIYSILKTVEEHRSSIKEDDWNDADLFDDSSHSSHTSQEEDEGYYSINNTEITPKELREYKTIHFPSGDLFSGHVHIATGEMIYGRLTSTRDMEIYEGPFYKGKKHGDGAVCMKMDNSGKFLGRYRDGMMDSGTLIVMRGEKSDFTYTGGFLCGDFHGVGKIATQNGSIYQGNFERGLFHGVGTLRMVHDPPENATGENNAEAEKEESVYTGDFYEGLFHGSGTMVYPDLSSYAGTWHHGEKLEGTETLPNGDVFEGSFSKGRRDGMGVLKLQNGRVTKRGVWKGEHLLEDVDVRINYADGHEYTGEHVASRPHGLGEMEYANFGSGAITYTGQFANGFRHGEGRALFHNSNSEYDGEWVCDEPIGLKIFQHNGPLIQEEEIDDEDVIQVFTMPMADRTASYRATKFAESGSQSQASGIGTESSGLATERLMVERGEDDDIVQVSIVPTADPDMSDRPSKLVSSTNDSLSGSILTFISIEDTADSTTMSSAKRSKSPRPVQLRRRRRSFKSVDFEGGLDLSMKSLTVMDFGDRPPEIYHYANGDVFKGHLDSKNLRQGSGVYTEHRMGSTYEGDWRDSMRHGVGLLTLSSGVEYCGEFYEDSIHGEGTITLIDDSVYTGSFRFGSFHGHGTLEDESTKRMYVGAFENGLRHGHGEETFSDGSRYVGEYQNGNRHGTGILYAASGQKLYEGEWFDDLKDGQGYLYSHRHDKSSWEGSYRGDFHRGKFCGMGLYCYSDGTSIEGQWVDDVPRDGDWSINYPDGSKFYGFATFFPEDNASGTSSVSTAGDCLRVPLPHGFGTLTYPSGQRYVGSFEYGEFQDAR